MKYSRPCKVIVSLGNIAEETGYTIDIERIDLVRQYFIEEIKAALAQLFLTDSGKS